MENGNMVVEPKKKNSIGLIILIVILMIGCLIGGYFLNDSGIFGGKTEQGEQGEQEEKEEENSDVVTDYDLGEADKLLAKFGISPNGSFWSYMTNIYLNGYDDQFKLLNAIANVSSDKKTQTNGSITIKYDDVNAVYKTLYGTNAKKEATDKYICIYLEGAFTYDGVAESYVQKKPNGCGGTTGPHTYAVREAKVNGDILTIKVAYDVGEHSASEYDSIANYKVSFKKIDNNYIFQSIEKVQ